MTTRTRFQKQQTATNHGTKGVSLRDKFATLTRRKASSTRAVPPWKISEPQLPVYVTGYTFRRDPLPPRRGHGSSDPDPVVIEQSEVRGGLTDDANHAMGGRVESQVVVEVDEEPVDVVPSAAANGSTHSVMTDASTQTPSIRRKPAPTVSIEDLPEDEVGAEIFYVPLEAAMTTPERAKFKEFLRESKLVIRRQQSLPPLPMNANRENIPPSRQRPPRPPQEDRKGKRPMYSQAKENLHVPGEQRTRRRLPAGLRLPPTPSPATAGGTHREGWSNATSELPSRLPSHSPPTIMVMDEHGLPQSPQFPRSPIEGISSPAPIQTPFSFASSPPLGRSQLENTTPRLQPESIVHATGSSRDDNRNGKSILMDDDFDDFMNDNLHASDISSVTLDHKIQDLEMMTLDQMFRKAENGIKLAKVLGQKFHLIPQKQSIQGCLDSVRGLQGALTAMLNVFLRRRSIPEEHWDCRTGNWQLKYEERTGAYRRSIDRLLDIRRHLDSMPRCLRGSNLPKLCTWLDAHTRKYASLAESINGLYDRLKVYYLHKQLEEAFRDEQEARITQYRQKASFYEERMKAKMRRERLRNDFNAAMNAPRPNFLELIT